MSQPSLVATAGASNANSYCTRQEADDYHDTHLYGDTWKSAEAWKKDAALIWATRLLDEQVAWNGVKSGDVQALRWPRADVEDPDGDHLDSLTIPTFLKHATAELARYLLQEDRTAERGYGISRVKADVVEVEFDRADEKPVLPASVRAMIGQYGSIAGGDSGWVKLSRV